MWPRRWLRVDVRVNWQMCLGDLGSAQCGLETGGRRRHERRVKRAAHRQANRALAATLFRDRHRALDGVDLARDHDLVWRGVVRGNDNATGFGTDRLERR